MSCSLHLFDGHCQHIIDYDGYVAALRSPHQLLAVLILHSRREVANRHAKKLLPRCGRAAECECASRSSGARPGLAPTARSWRRALGRPRCRGPPRPSAPGTRSSCAPCARCRGDPCRGTRHDVNEGDGRPLSRASSNRFRTSPSLSPIHFEVNIAADDAEERVVDLGGHRFGQI